MYAVIQICHPSHACLKPILPCLVLGVLQHAPAQLTLAVEVGGGQLAQFSFLPFPA